MRIGIFGGSFNPIHRGHLKLAEEALSELNLDKVLFVPSHITPLKDKTTFLPATLRLKLLKEAIKKNSFFEVSDCELKRKGISYTVDTLRYFKRKYKNKATLFFLAGADTLKNFPRWKSPKEVLRLARFVVTDRPGTTLRNIPEGMIYLPINALPVSSSEIRPRFHRTKKLGDLKSKTIKKFM